MKDDKDLFECLMICALISDDTNPSGGGGSRSTGRASLLLTVIVFIAAACGIIALICILTARTCAAPGCGNVPAGDSRYCTYHRKMYSSGTSNSSAAAKTTTAPKVTSAPKQTTRKKASSAKKTVSQPDDPYGVYDYDDPEDFYFDNYDEFDGYEDAEDHYYEYGE